MCHGERTRENGACFSVLSLAVTKEQGIGSGIVMPQFTRLPNETTTQHRAVIHLRTGRDYKIITNHSMSDMYGSRHVTIHTTISQTAGSADMAVITNPDILD